MMSARDVMTPAPATVMPWTTVGEAWELMRELDVRHLPVIQHGALVGMLSDRDLAYLDLGRTLAAEGADAARRLLGRPVGDVMSPDVVSVDADGDLGEVIDLLLENKIGAVPVTRPDTRELVGIISYVDILRTVRDVLEDS
jgi:acetoin utilization protein AcuB